MEAGRVERSAIARDARHPSGGRIAAKTPGQWERRDVVVIESARDVFFHASHGALVEEVLDRGCEAHGLAFADLVRLLEVKVSLDVPRRPLRNGIADGDQTTCRILRDRQELAGVRNVRRE